MSPKEICGLLSLYTVNLYIKSYGTSSAFILTYICMIGSGSRKLLNTDQIRIRIWIHNTGTYNMCIQDYFVYCFQPNTGILLFILFLKHIKHIKTTKTTISKNI